MESGVDIAIIGCGNMGAALIAGYAANTHDSTFLVVDPDVDRAKSLLPPEVKAIFSETLQPLASMTARMTILAVKPQSCATLLPTIAETTAADGLVLSIVAGGDTSSLRKYRVTIGAGLDPTSSTAL